MHKANDEPRFRSLVDAITIWAKEADLDRNNEIIQQMAPVAASKRKITQKDVYEIALVKNARQGKPHGLALSRAALTAGNSDLDVQQAFKAALAATDEGRRLQCLTSLHGVGVPIASCILAWTFPDRWGVIDRRAWMALWKRQLVHDHADGRNLGPQSVESALRDNLKAVSGYRFETATH